MFGGPVSVYPDTNPSFDHDIQTGAHSRADGYTTDFNTNCFSAGMLDNVGISPVAS
ncbi:hypothetical protein DER46DRAFT_595594 [Fusarium sp. MPI-SDFR-AT-0072]|nr:hypothetical protein DER46DRAFT_595594 [Fusarium sp. MPI-SDFR-AT-0072]